jgi:hypothetical protein
VPELEFPVTNREKEKGKFPKIVLPSVPRAALRFEGVFPLSSQKFYTLRLCCLAQIRIERSQWELAAAGATKPKMVRDFAKALALLPCHADYRHARAKKRSTPYSVLSKQTPIKMPRKQGNVSRPKGVPRPSLDCTRRNCNQNWE